MRGCAVVLLCMGDPQERRLSIRDDGAAIAGLLAITLLLFWPALTGHVLDLRDFPRWAWPSRELWRSAILAGRLPQWNPGVGLGVATLAAPVHGSFYPGHLLLLIAPTWWSLGVTWTLHGFLGGLGGYVLARKLGCRPAAAWLAGASFSVGGYAVSMWGNGDRVLTCAWVPWSAVALRALANAGGVLGARLALAAAALAMVALAGDPFFWLYAVGLGLLVAWGDSTDQAGPRALRVAARTLAALGLASLLAAPALVPAFALLGESERASGVAAAEASSWSMHALRLLELVAPGALGDPLEAAAYPGARFVGEPGLGATPWAIALYSGVGLLLFAPFAGRRRLGYTLGGGALVAVIAALGRHTAGYAWLVAAFPPLRYLRYPEKHVLLAVCALALLAALGCERALRGQVRVRSLAAAFAIAAALAIGLAPGELRATTAGGLAHALGFAVLATGSLLLARRHARWTCLLPMVAGADLLLAAIPLLRWYDARALREPPALATLIRREPTPYPPRLYRPHLDGGSLETLPDNLGELWGIAHVPGFDPALPARLHRAWDHLPSPIVMTLFAIDWMVVPAAEVPPGLQPTAALHDWRLVRWPANPRALLVDRVTVAQDDAALALMAGPQFAPRADAVIAPGPQAVALHGGGAPGACGVERYLAEEVSIRCEARTPALLVLADGYAPGWSATVDAAPAVLHRVDVVLRGVYVGPGVHRVEMRYRTPGLAVGLALGGLGMLLCGLLVARERLTRAAAG